MNRESTRPVEHPSATTVRREEPDTRRPGPDAAEALMRTCPICSSELEERKCKLFCPDPRCGYFLSCADYY